VYSVRQPGGYLMRLSTRRRNLEIIRFITLGHTQKEAGEKWSISRSAIGNIVRIYSWEKNHGLDCRNYEKLLGMIEKDIANITYMDGKCKRCNSKIQEGKQEYCSDCRKAFNSLIRRRLYSDLNNEERIKATCRSMTKYFIRSGAIKKTPCVLCGSDRRVESHHNDYSKPKEVVFLCLACHRAKHANRETMSDNNGLAETKHLH